MPVRHRLYHSLTPALLLFLTSPGELRAHGDLSGRILEMRTHIAQQADGELQLALAGLLYQDGDLAETLSTLERLDCAAPGKFPTDKLRGSALLALQRPAEARVALDRFLTRFPGDVTALLLRARALSAISLTAAALADGREVIRRSVTPEPDLFHEVAAALASAGCQDEALSILEQGLETLGLIPSLAQRALEVEVSLKRYDAALARVESMRRAAPRPEQWMAKRAAILAAAGRITESREAWQSLITHLTTLPAAERGSHAMCRLAAEAREGLKALRGLSGLEPHPATSSFFSPQQLLSLTKL